jgi:streptogramin lyase
VLDRIPMSPSPQTVSIGKDAVWVGLSTLEPGVPDTIVRVDPRSDRQTASYTVPDGVRALVATPHGLWVIHRLKPSVSRVNPETGLPDKHMGLGNNDFGSAAYAEGFVWVTIPLEDTVARIDAKTGRKISSGVGRRPTGIAARGGRIWVTSYIDHTISRINPRTAQPIGRAVRVKLNPYALAVSRDSVWLTAVGHGDIVRVR